MARASSNYDPFAVTTAQIQTACSTLKCDKRIAAYYGVSVDRVVKARAAIVTPRTQRSLRAGKAYSGDGIGDKQSFDDMARDGSADLLAALTLQFQRFADKHGYTDIEAGALLMNGLDRKPAGWQL